MTEAATSMIFSQFHIHYLLCIATIIFAECIFGQAKPIIPRNDDYIVIDLLAMTHQFSAKPPDLSHDACRTTELWLRHIPSGTFIMGSAEDEDGRDGDEETPHTITITKDFYIGVFECTQAQWGPSWGTPRIHPSTRGRLTL